MGRRKRIGEKPELPEPKNCAVLLVAIEEMSYSTMREIIKIVKGIKEKGGGPVVYTSPEYEGGDIRKKAIKHVDKYVPLKRKNISGVIDMFKDLNVTAETLLVFGEGIGRCINGALSLADIPNSIKRVVFPTFYIGRLGTRQEDEFYNIAKQRLEKEGIEVIFVEVPKYKIIDKYIG